MVGVIAGALGQGRDGRLVVGARQETQRGLAALRLRCGQLGVGPVVAVLEEELAGAELAFVLEGEETQALVAAGLRQVGLPTALDQGEGDALADAGGDGGRTALAAAAPGLQGAVRGAGVEAVFGAEEDAGDRGVVAVATAAILGLQGTTGVGEEQTPVRPGRREAQLIGVEGQSRDGAVVQLGLLGERVIVGLFAGKDGDRARLVAGDEPIACGRGRQHLDGVGQREALQLLGLLRAVNDAQSLAGGNGEALVGEGRQRAGGLFDGGAVGAQRATGQLDELGPRRGRNQRALRAHSQRAAASQRALGEGQRVDVDAVKGGLEAFVVGRAEGQRRAGAGERRDLAAVFELLFRDFHRSTRTVVSRCFLGAGAARCAPTTGRCTLRPNDRAQHAAPLRPTRPSRPRARGEPWRCAGARPCKPGARSVRGCP